MKTTLLTFGMMFGMLQLALAGGNSSIVTLTVKSIMIEEGKVIIKGDGMIRKRVMSDAEHGDATAFGQPAQMLHAKVSDDCVFEMVPYNTRTDIKGVPGGGDIHSEEAKAMSKRHWDGLLETANRIKVGDTVQIGYQREILTMTGLRVTNIVGAGSLSIQKSAAAK